MKQKHDINAFLDVVNEKIGLVSGAKRLYTLTGQPIRSTSALEHNKVGFENYPPPPNPSLVIRHFLPRRNLPPIEQWQVSHFTFKGSRV
jgi:hypothetical protein